MKTVDYIAIAIMIITIIAVVIIVTTPQEIRIPQEESVIVSIRTDIEDNTENDFFYPEEIFGERSNTMIIFNITQFIEMIPSDKIVYVTFETGDTRIVFGEIVHRHMFTKKYWIFNEHGEGFITYKEDYQYQNNGKAFWVGEHDMKSVTFEWTDKYQVEYENEDRRGIYSFLVFFVGLLIAEVIRGETEEEKKKRKRMGI
ncbi:MAG: hypothetical protein KAI71_00255 [Candidatus Pacebacteria bacterium]|nr:hypothetical protein [Candidatus Paceibacterota bacterium]